MKLLALFIFAVGITGLAAGYSTLRARAFEAAFPPQGRFVDAHGFRLHILEAGQGDGVPVVLLHGASGNARDQMTGLGVKLADRHQVIALDRPGHGYSQRPPNGDAATPAGQARYIAEALQELGIGPAIMVGHSWSGALAAALALNHPERVAGLVLLAPVTHPWPGGITWYYRIASLPVIGPIFCRLVVVPVGEAVLTASVGSVFAPEQAPEGYAEQIAARLTLRPENFRFNGIDMAKLKAAVAEQSPRYGEINVPTVVMHGDADGSVSPDIHSRAIARQIDGARLIMLEGVGHMPHHTAADRVVAEIDQLSNVIRFRP